MAGELTNCMRDLNYTYDHATDYMIRNKLAEIIHDLCAFALDCDERLGSAYQKGQEEKKK